jgi:DnaJ-class molecular chaperone
MSDDRTIVDCARCRGTGRIKRATGLVTAEWETCPACRGSGKQRV